MLRTVIIQFKSYDYKKKDKYGQIKLREIGSEAVKIVSFTTKVFQYEQIHEFLEHFLKSRCNSSKKVEKQTVETKSVIN